MIGGFEHKAFHDGIKSYEPLFAYEVSQDKQRHIVERQFKLCTMGEITLAQFTQRKDFIDKGFREDNAMDQSFVGNVWMSPALRARKKTASLRFKAGTADGDTFSLYGCWFGNLDRQDDIIEPGAVKNCEDFVKTGCILLGHEQALLPIAMPVSCVQNNQGMLITARWHTTWAAQEAKATVKERMAAGLTVSASIGYLVNAERFENRNGKNVRILSDIEVYEVSLVNLPANPMARVISLAA